MKKESTQDGAYAPTTCVLFFFLLVKPMIMSAVGIAAIIYTTGDSIKSNVSIPQVVVKNNDGYSILNILFCTIITSSANPSTNGSKSMSRSNALLPVTGAFLPANMYAATEMIKFNPTIAHIGAHSIF